MKRIVFVAFIVAVFIGGDVGFLEAVDSVGKEYSLRGGGNTTGLPNRTKMNINEVSSWYDNDGTEEINSSTGNSGLVYPQGTAGAIFTAGLMWTGEFNDGQTPIIRTNGHSYNTGLVAGAIMGSSPEDPSASDVRIWRVRRDFATADLTRDAAELNSIATSQVSEGQRAAVRTQYETDWIEWPASKGAPFYDSDGDGMYTPEVIDGVPTLFPDADEPGVGGGDQVIWYVANDMDTFGASSPWGSPPSAGMEMQLTIWGYARTDALGHVLFKKYRLIYKGTPVTPIGSDVTNMYLAQWSDPDLGSFSDDFAGCDTTLSLGYCYNGVAVDPQFAGLPVPIPPPAIGYDFLQGPRVFTGDPSDTTAVFNLERLPPGWVNLPMTAFIYFAAGGMYSDPPFNGAGGLQWNCMLQGFPPIPQPPPCPAPPTDPFSGSPAGPFWLYDGSDGSSAPDPNAPTGWVDGQIDGPGDRRIILASGPFTMALGDTQELVSGVVGGRGSTYLKSIEVMKFRDRAVQEAYNNLFDLPKPPASPDLKITALDKKLILDWESNPNAVSATEDPISSGGHAFQGYNIWQVPNTSATFEEAIRLATIDRTADEDQANHALLPPGSSVKTIFQQTFDLESGEILNLPVQFGNDTGIRRTWTITRDEFRSAPLVNGTPYFFAVTAYNFTDDPQASTITLESPLVIQTGIPGTPDPGTRLPYSENDTVAVDAGSLVNDAVVRTVVFEPTRPAEQTLEVHFDSLGLYHVLEMGDTLIDSESLLSDSTYRFIDKGLTMNVGPPPVGVKSVLDGDGNDVYGTLIQDRSGDINTLGGSGVSTGRTYEIVLTDDSSFAINKRSPTFFSGAVRVPFRVYDLGRTSEDPRVEVMAIFEDFDASGSWNLRENPPAAVTGDVFEPLWISSIPYESVDDSAAVKGQQTPLIAVSNDSNNVNSAVHRVYVSTDASTGMSAQFNKFLEIRPGDVTLVPVEGVVEGNLQAARDDVTLINVFPNPYYGINSRETSREVRFVTFNHMPDRATIRIFNLAGVLVRTLVKDETTQNPTSPQHFQWDLQNDNGLPVASGIYLIHMELKNASGEDLGVRFLKLAVIQEQQFLTNY